MKKNRLFAVLMCVLLIAGMLAGCGPREENGETTSQPSEGANQMEGTVTDPASATQQSFTGGTQASEDPEQTENTEEAPSETQKNDNKNENQSSDTPKQTAPRELTPVSPGGQKNDNKNNDPKQTEPKETKPASAGGQQEDDKTGTPKQTEPKETEPDSPQNTEPDAAEPTENTAQEQPVEDSYVVTVSTPYGKLYYQEQWAQYMKTVQVDQGDSLAVGFVAVIDDVEYPLFTLTIGEGDGTAVGRITDGNGTERDVYLTVEDSLEHPELAEDEQNRLYAMQEEINFVIENMK